MREAQARLISDLLDVSPIISGKLRLGLRREPSRRLDYPNPSSTTRVASAN